MPQYLKLAEKIYLNVKNSKGFVDEPLEDLNNLMIELRIEIKETDFKILYNYINFEDLLMNSKDLPLSLDISILPKSKNRTEYILWLASFIEKVTISKNKKATHLNSKVIVPDYHYDDVGNIVNRSKNNGEAIVSYFKDKQSV
ncbi:hypothetical protein MMP71_05810 [Acinetobacter dispersus]|uniref:hypothetical protein n=1 Tax=Acinetobacter dispersus TaxID=70348 RepID=UPI001F4A30BB|nr:hypothetical protein [Acinetobacter dispersus]MCH7383365.1 hypothetical protein [Acinetobacter dispersus]